MSGCLRRWFITMDRQVKQLLLSVFQFIHDNKLTAWVIEYQKCVRQNTTVFTLCMVCHLLVEPRTDSRILGCYIPMYSPIARSVVLRRRYWTLIDLLSNVFIHKVARSRLSTQMAEPCKERNSCLPSLSSIMMCIFGWACWWYYLMCLCTHLGYDLCCIRH